MWNGRALKFYSNFVQKCSFNNIEEKKTPTIRYDAWIWWGAIMHVDCVRIWAVREYGAGQPSIIPRLWCVRWGRSLVPVPHRWTIRRWVHISAILLSHMSCTQHSLCKFNRSTGFENQLEFGFANKISIRLCANFATNIIGSKHWLFHFNFIHANEWKTEWFHHIFKSFSIENHSMRGQINASTLCSFECLTILAGKFNRYIFTEEQNSANKTEMHNIKRDDFSKLIAFRQTISTVNAEKWIAHTIIIMTHSQSKCDTSYGKCCVTVYTNRIFLFIKIQIHNSSHVKFYSKCI